MGNRSGLDPRTLESLIRRLADKPAYLHWLRVGQGERVELVAVDDVCFFRSDRKYTAALTRDREHLVRTPIGELAARLDPSGSGESTAAASSMPPRSRRPAGICADATV